jgi:hypothetical protein
MLARYLRRADTRPVRYALPPQTDPAHAEAMRNFLALHTRAYDLPHLAHTAQQGGHLQHPLIQSLLRGVLGGHEHDALGPLLDSHMDQGVQSTPMIHPQVSTPWSDPGYAAFGLMNHLHALHAVLSGQGRPDNFGPAPSPAEIHRRYATGALRGLSPGPLGHPYYAQLLNRHSGALDPAQVDLMEQAQVTGGNNPRELLVPAYNVAHALGLRHPAPGGIGDRAHHARTQIAQALRQGVLPAIHRGLT